MRRKCRRSPAPTRAFLVPPPAARMLRGSCPSFGVGLEDVARAAGDALEQRAIDVAARVGQVEPEDHALGHADRGSASARPRNRAADEPLGARRRRLGLRRQRRPPRRRDRVPWRTARGTSGSACRRSRGPTSPRAGRKQPRRVPEARVAHALRRDLDDEDGRAVHQHHVARIEHADAQRLGPRVDRTRRYGRALGEPGLRRRARRDTCPRSRSSRAAPGSISTRQMSPSSCSSRSLVRQIDRREAAGRVVVDHARAGQPLHDEGRRGDDPSPSSPRPRAGCAAARGSWGRPIWLVSALPQRSSSRSSPIAVRQLLDLPRRAGVDAVEHAVHQRLARRHRRAACTGRWRSVATALMSPGDTPAVGEQLVGNEAEIAPPILARPVLGPARLRHQHLVRPRRLRDDPCPSVDQHALALEGADVDAEIVRHGCSRRGRGEKPGPIRDRPSTTSWVSPTRSPRSQTSSAEWV